MSPQSRRRTLIIVAVIVLLLLLLLALARCQPKEPAPIAQESATTPAPTTGQSSSPAPERALPEEVLGPATLQAPAEVAAGKPVSITWTGPDNPKDYITIVRKDAPSNAYDNYKDTRAGSPLEVLAPIEPGEWELRYVADRSRAVLARQPITVVENHVTLQAAAEVVAGTLVSVAWTGPNNAGDYLTLVPRSLPDGQYGNYTDTRKGSPLQITAPITPGDIELRYMTGQGAKVLQRLPLRVVAAEITLSGPAFVRAGEKIAVAWTGPNNAGDYVTLVPAALPDGQYASYADTRSGPSLTLTAPKSAGPGEIRYMSGQGAKVLKRLPIVVTP